MAPKQYIDLVRFGAASGSKECHVKTHKAEVYNFRDGNGSTCASLEIFRLINYPLAVMFNGQYLDADGGNSVNDPVGSLKQLSHFVIHEGL